MGVWRVNVYSHFIECVNMPTWCIYVCKDVVNLWMGEHKSLHVQCFARYGRVCECVKCLRTLLWMSECMCETVLPECHTENWVWVVLQSKTSRSLFSNKPNGRNISRCHSGVLGFLCSPLAFMNPAAVLESFRNLCKLEINTVYFKAGS